MHSGHFTDFPSALAGTLRSFLQWLHWTCTGGGVASATKTAEHKGHWTDLPTALLGIPTVPLQDVH